MPIYGDDNYKPLMNDLINSEKVLLTLAQHIQAMINYEVESLSVVLEDERKSGKDKVSTFEIYDQKANQLFNLLSAVMKALREMRSSAKRNLL